MPRMINETMTIRILFKQDLDLDPSIGFCPNFSETGSVKRRGLCLMSQEKNVETSLITDRGIDRNWIDGKMTTYNSKMTRELAV